MSVPDKWELHGYAMTCRNDCIANSFGETPEGLLNAMQTKHFRAQMNECAGVILGRRAHEATPNPQQAVRAIMTRSVSALEHKEGGWWWNPATMELEKMLPMVAPNGGRIAVIGGQTTLEHFLESGLSALHVYRAESVAIQDGLKLLAECDRKTTVDMVLRDAGMELADRKLIDLKAPISLSTWRRV